MKRTMQQKIKHAGLTLFELLIVITILAIIASFAYPSYANTMLELKRLEAKSALYDIQTRYERYYAIHKTYSGATLGGGKTSIYPSTITQNGHYKLEMSEIKPQAYQLSAIPISAATKGDKQCGTFILNSLGEQAISGTGSAYRCWQR